MLILHVFSPKSTAGLSHLSRVLRGAPTLAGLGLLAVSAVGCCETYITRAAELQIRLEDQTRRASDLESRIAELEKENRLRGEQVAALQGTPPASRELLVRPTELELGPLTGGRNFDDKQGDDGLRIYAVLKDAAGDRIKQAGRFEVELFDLEAGGRRLGRWTFDEKQAAEAWNSVLTNYNYVLDVRWQNGVPARNGLTVRVKFTDLLTGRTLDAQREVTFERPAGS